MKAEGIAFVTGASRGMGSAIALELASRGFEVWASMREPDHGAALAARAASAGANLRVVRLDVTRPDTIDLPDGMRVLVNNAGLDGSQLPVEFTPLEEWRTLFETNLFGLLEVTRRAIPKLRARGGVVCNIGSASVLVPMPFFAAYRASKAAVSALGESLRTELAPFGVRVLEVLPGAIGTDMFARSERPPEAGGRAGYAEMAERVHQARRNSASTPTSAERAASAIADAILDDSAPLRVAPDPMGAGLLATWRALDDEAAMRPMVAFFAGRDSN
jgi:NAD(P)-dependent dehydrogenase (short-subunit alcohol dehydrogenase family)